MTHIDFYTLESDSSGDRFMLTCRLVDTFRDSGERILIYCPEPDLARHLDRLLWTFRDDSFLPHGLVGTADPTATPVLISTDGSPDVEDQVLVNLALQVPEFFGRFRRLCEPIDLDPKIRAAGRERFRYYRDRGYPLQHHGIRL